MHLNLSFGVSAVVLASCCFVAATAEPNGFLRPSKDLLEDLEAAAGRDYRDATLRRVTRLEDAMRQMFETLPKNSAGNLDVTGVRYMLRRLFSHNHGWRVRGLEDYDRQGENGTALAAALGGHFGKDANGAFHKKATNEGFSLHHSAVLAATFENFAHGETVQRLKFAYKMLGYSLDQALPASEMQMAMRTFMLIYMFGVDIDHTDRHELLDLAQGANHRMPFWSRSKEFLAEIWQTIVEEDAVNNVSSSSWDTMVKVLDRFTERYGRWQNSEAVLVKEALLRCEETPGSGRVPLERFYSSYLNGTFYFVEAPAFLRALGSLDESDPERPTVIMANYINGMSSCTYPSRFYSVCSVDECEALWSHIEGEVRSPRASPDRLLQIVSALPSDTVKAPRTLSDSLVQRLSEIAEMHGGMVPLHGRLFTQWLHHAYPYECSYPHIAGTTMPMPSHDFRALTGEASRLSVDEMHEFIQAAGERERSIGKVDSAIPITPWSSEEDLFVVEKHGKAWFLSLVKMIGPLFAISILVPLLRSSSMPSKVSGTDKIYV